MDKDFPAVAVTGGASGIGYTVSEAFARVGYPVAIVDLASDRVAEAAARLTAQTGADACGVVANVTDRDACQAAYDQATNTLGPIGVLVNNAGIMPQVKGRIEELPPEHFDEMMDVHVGGAVNWCRLVMPNMRAAGFGRVINISSVHAFQPSPFRVGYATAKKALRGLTEALALDTARGGITVNAIAPGYVLTDTLQTRAREGVLDHDGLAERTPVGRWARPEEIAHVALFLAHPTSAYITGVTLPVDGGLSIRGDAGEDITNSPYSSHPHNQ